MKKALSLLLTIILVMSSATCVFASSNKTVVSEYDLYKQLKVKSDRELAETGLTLEEIKELREFDFNEVFAERAKLDDSTLTAMGYSKGQIKSLREIYGPDTTPKLFSMFFAPVEKTDSQKLEMVAARGLFADLSITTTHAGGSSSYIKVNFEWEWSNLPAYFGGKDALGIVWKGTNSEGKPLNVALDKSASYHKLYEDNNMVTVPPVKHSWKIIDEYGGAQDEFQLGYRVEDLIGWYKSGDGVVKLIRTGSNSIKEVSLKFAYGHTYVGISTGININPVSYFIGFNWKTETMDENSARYSTSGKI